MSGSMAPYRHTEIVRVVECDSCERARVRAAELDEHVRRNRAIRTLAIKRSVGVLLGRGPWLYGAWLAAKWLVLTYPTAPIWAVMIVCGLIIGSVTVTVMGVHSVRDAARDAGLNKPAR